MSKQIISEIPNRESFFHLLSHNQQLIYIILKYIFKFEFPMHYLQEG
jgi:hypothetical protein